MSLPLDSSRCQGRMARSGGFSSLCIECIDCARRTDIPITDKPLTYIEPPKILHRWLGCPMHVGPDDEVVVLP